MDDDRFLANSIKWLSGRESDLTVDLNHKIDCAVGILDDLIKQLKTLLPLLVHLDTRISITNILNLTDSRFLELEHVFETLCSNVDSHETKKLSKRDAELVEQFQQLREASCRRMKLLHRFEKQKLAFLQKRKDENIALQEKVAILQAKFDEISRRLDHPPQDLVASIREMENSIDNMTINQPNQLLNTVCRQEKLTNHECMELDKTIKTYEALRETSDDKRHTFMKHDLEKEVAQLGKMYKVQVNLKAWIDKYDKGVGPLLLELVDLEEERDLLLDTNHDLKYNRIRPNEAYYLECMELQEQWRREAIEARLKVMRMHRCARTIQLWYRGILKKRKKKKKGKKKGRGRKVRR